MKLLLSFKKGSDSNELSKLSVNMRKGIFSGIALLLLIVFFAITQGDKFLAPANIVNVLQQVVTYSIIGFGLTFVLVSGGTDLSAGASMALSGIIVLTLLKFGLPLPIAIILSLVFGLLMGILNGFTIEVLGVVPFIATLGTQWVFRGLANVFVEGKPIYVVDVISDPKTADIFYQLGAGRFGGGTNGIPYSVAIALVYGIILYFVLAKTRIGRQIYACGSNLEAAKLSGINTVRTRMFAYMMSGLSATICGVLVTSRFSSAQPLAGQGYELEAIAAAVLGGTSNSGGQGSIINTIIGALMMGVLRNGLNLSGVNSYLQQVIIGFVLVGAVALEVYQRRKQS